MAIPDEEIRNMIRKFRGNYLPKDFCIECPFMANGKYLCSLCTRIFNIMPPIADAYMVKLRWIKYRKGSISYRDETCPCKLYGPEYTAYKIAEFMGEI